MIKTTFQKCNKIVEFFLDENENKTFSRLNRDAEVELNDLEKRQQTIAVQPRSLASSPRTALTNQLQKLEKKQYELTKQVRIELSLYLIYESE